MDIRWTLSLHMLHEHGKRKHCKVIQACVKNNTHYAAWSDCPFMLVPLFSFFGLGAYGR